MSRFLICGNRDWVDKSLIKNMIKVHNPSIIIEGEARGADSLAREIGEELGIEVIKFPANWTKYHKAAGPIRSQQMLDEGKPDAVIAFHDDIENSGGQNTCSR